MSNTKSTRYDLIKWPERAGMIDSERPCLKCGAGTRMKYRENNRASFTALACSPECAAHIIGVHQDKIFSPQNW